MLFESVAYAMADALFEEEDYYAAAAHYIRCSDSRGLSPDYFFGRIFKKQAEEEGMGQDLESGEEEN